MNYFVSFDFYYGLTTFNYNF